MAASGGWSGDTRCSRAAACGGKWTPTWRMALVETDLQLAQRAVVTGAAVAVRYFGALAELSRELKPDGSVVTAADRAVETAVREVLSAARPDDAVLGEEQGLSERPGRPGLSERTGPSERPGLAERPGPAERPGLTERPGP